MCIHNLSGIKYLPARETCKTWWGLTISFLLFIIHSLKLTTTLVALSLGLAEQQSLLLKLSIIAKTLP